MHKHDVLTKCSVKRWASSVGLFITGFGLWKLYRDVRTICDMLNQALPIQVMTGEHKISEYIYLSEDVTASRVEPWQWSGTSVSTSPTFDDVTWKPIMSRTPWEFVAMAHSEDHRHRRLGLRLLTSLHHLHPSFGRQIAQASNHWMALALARSSAADLNMLLPPPPLPLDMRKSDILEDLQNLLRGLPKDDSLRCIQYFTSLALKEINFHMEECDSEWWHEGSEKLVPKKERPLSDKAKKTLILRALLAHSSVPKHRKEIVQSRGLQTLMKLCQMSKDIDQHTLVAQILGNLAQDAEISREKIFQAGCVSMLARWSRSSTLDLSLSAVRALENLSQDTTLENGIYLAHPLHWDSELKTLGDVVFIHGLLGGAFKTWRQKVIPENCMGDDPHTNCWPKDWLAHDCPHLRILLVDYETRLTEWSRSCPYEDQSRTLGAQSEQLLQKLLSADVGRRPIIWVAHSMGGLLVKQMLLQADGSKDPRALQLSSNTKGIVFYAVPHRGSPLASFHLGSRHLLLPSPEVNQLQLGSAELKRLHDAFSIWVSLRNVPCISYGELQKTVFNNLGMAATFVSTESADPGFGEFHTVDTDHLYICKPCSRSSAPYSQLARFIHSLIGHTFLDELQHPIEVSTEEKLTFVLGTSFT